MIENLHKLESILGYWFRRPEILERAVTHSSAANEKKLPAHDNEQMEFLGDSLSGSLATPIPRAPPGGRVVQGSRIRESANLSKPGRQLEVGELLCRRRRENRGRASGIAG
jgi:ribonuclease-3